MNTGRSAVAPGDTRADAELGPAVGGTRAWIPRTVAIISRERALSYQLPSVFSWTPFTSRDYRWGTTRKAKHWGRPEPRFSRFRPRLNSIILAPAGVSATRYFQTLRSGMGLSSSPRRGCQKIKRRRHLAKAFKMTFTRKHACPFHHSPSLE